MQILTYDFKTALAPLCATADIEQCNTVGWTALHHACFHGHNDVVAVLLKASAKLSRRNHLGATAMDMAAASGHVSTLK